MADAEQDRQAAEQQQAAGDVIEDHMPEAHAAVEQAPKRVKPDGYKWGF